MKLELRSNAISSERYVELEPFCAYIITETNKRIVPYRYVRGRFQDYGQVKDSVAVFEQLVQLVYS